VTAEIVQLHQGPSLNPEDIPAQLRALADRIERGEEGDVDAVFAIIPREQDHPIVFGWGQTTQAFDAIIQFELARQWLVRAAAGLPTD